MATSPEPSGGRKRTLLLVVSILGNLALAVALVLVLAGPTDSAPSRLTERHYSGDQSAGDKIAVVRIAGVLSDYSKGHVLKQIEQAARDGSVKGVVVRVESPGGTVTASDEIYRALVELRDNSHTRFSGTGPKPMVASMGSIAASGGYYVAMPATRVLAEPTTITGSIGVFAALPNVSELAEKNGVRVELVKAGAIKAGGSPFQPLTPEERQPWQDMVDHAYDRFLTVVAAGRPGLSKERLATEKVPFPLAPPETVRKQPDEKPDVALATRLQRYRADGGTFTPPQARELGLIDEIGDLSGAIQLVAGQAGLTRYRAISYEKPKSLAEIAFGIETRQGTSSLGGIVPVSVLAPRLWYLSPGYELAGALEGPESR